MTQRDSVAKVNIDRLKTKLNSTRKLINKAIKDKALLDDIGNNFTKRIIADAKSGKIPGTKNSYKPLAKQTIDNRQRNAKFNILSQDYKLKKSNLTYTGQLLESIKHKVVPSRARIEINAMGMHKPVRGKRGPIGKAIPNKKLAEFHDKGKGVPRRIIFNISEKMENIAKSKIIRNIRRILVQAR